MLYSADLLQIVLVVPFLVIAFCLIHIVTIIYKVTR